MKQTCGSHFLVAAAVLLAAWLFSSRMIFAHCDGLDGPVVKAAQQALAEGNVTNVFIWVQPTDEAEITAAFEKTLAVRKLNSEAKELADHYFFETLVRIHRAGEGAPYTGLKPAGRDLGPAIPAADKALRDGKLEPVQKILAETIHESLHARFAEVQKKKNFARGDIEAGREFVKAYVEYIHLVEGVYEKASRSPHGHFTEAADATEHHGH